MEIGSAYFTCWGSAYFTCSLKNLGHYLNAWIYRDFIEAVLKRAVRIFPSKKLF